MLINGRGQFNCSLAAKFVNTSLVPQCQFKGGEECAPEILHVEPNKTYRIRIASTTSMASLNLAISVSTKSPWHITHTLIEIFHYLFPFVSFSLVNIFFSFVRRPVPIVCVKNANNTRFNNFFPTHFLIDWISCCLN